MQDAMKSTLGELWKARKKTTPVKSPREAIILASIVEKETGKPEERRMVAGVYANRLRMGMALQADPTVLYPVTKRSEERRVGTACVSTCRSGWSTYH